MSDSKVKFLKEPNKIVELFALIMGVTYVLGYIIVNSYYVSLGIGHLSVFKIKYLSAGILYLLVIIVFIISLFPFILTYFITDNQMRDENDKLKASEQSFMKAVSLLFSSFITILIFLNNVFDIKVNKNSWEISNGTLLIALFIMVELLINKILKRNDSIKLLKIRKVLRVVWVVLVTGFVLYLESLNPLPFLFLIASLVFLSSLRKVFQGPTINKELFKSTREVYFLVYGISMFLIAVIDFGTMSYGHIKPEYGGGKPIEIKYSLRTDPSKMKAARLVDQSEREVIIILDDNRVLQLLKDDITSIEYVPIKK